MLTSKEDKISIILDDKSWVFVFAAGITCPNGFLWTNFVKERVVKYQISVILQYEIGVLVNYAELRDLGAPDLLTTL